MLIRSSKEKKKEQMTMSRQNKTGKESSRRRQHPNLFCSMMTRWVLERGDRNGRLSRLNCGLEKNSKIKKKRSRRRGRRGEEFEPDGSLLRLMGPRCVGGGRCCILHAPSLSRSCVILAKQILDHFGYQSAAICLSMQQSALARAQIE